MQASPNRSGLPPKPPSKTPSPVKQNSPYNHVPLSVKQTSPLSSNKMANRLLQLAEVRKKSEMVEVPKAHTKITLDEYFEKKSAFWNQIRFINEENRCVSKNEDYITLRNLLLEFSKITPVQVCSAVKDAIDKGYYLGEDDVLINPTPPEPSTPGNYRYKGATAPPAYYNNSAPRPSAPPANASYYTGATAPPPPYYMPQPSAPPANANYYKGATAPPPVNNQEPRELRGGTKRKNRKGRKTRRS